MSDYIQIGFGGISRSKDQRDYKIGLSQSPVLRPAVYKKDRSSTPVKYQSKYGTCGGHAGAAYISFLSSHDLSPKYFWKQLKRDFGTPLSEDTGVDMRTIFKTMQNVGVCHENLCPNVIDPTFIQYSDPSSITDAMLNDGYPFGIQSYAFTDYPSFEQIKQAIYQNNVVIALVDCGTGWYTDSSGNLSWDKKSILPIRLGKFESGHFVVLTGYDEKYIYFRNSWSERWADNGDGYFSSDYIKSVREIGAGIAGPSTKQQIATAYTKLLLVLQQLLQEVKKKITN